MPQRFAKNDVISKIGNTPEFVFFIMSGVVQNETTDRYIEAGQMINHDYIFQNVNISQNCVADTDVVTVLKYSRETFMLVVGAFPDMYEEMKQVVEDKWAHIENTEFLKNAIKSDETRKMIISHYNDIIQDEQKQYRRTNKTLAMKLNMKKGQIIDKEEFPINEEKRKVTTKGKSAQKKELKHEESESSSDSGKMDDSHAQINKQNA